MDMITPDESAGARSGARFRPAQGMDVLDVWSRTASQSARNAVYRVLFSVLDGTVFDRYLTLDAGTVTSEFRVHVRNDLVVKIRLDEDAFAIAYIGPDAVRSPMG